jgi:hypothetical protein
MGYTFAEVIQMELDSNHRSVMKILQEFLSTPDRQETAEEMASFFDARSSARLYEWKQFARRLDANRVGSEEKGVFLKQYRDHHEDTR